MLESQILAQVRAGGSAPRAASKVELALFRGKGASLTLRLP
jgi:hypothetical protein